MENLSEFENTLLSLLDFTAMSVHTSQKVPNFARLQQLTKEWSTELLYLARKQTINEINKKIEKYADDVKQAKGKEGYNYASGKMDAMVILRTLISCGNEKDME